MLSLGLFPACRAQTRPGPSHPAQVPSQPRFPAQEPRPHPLPAPLPSAGKVPGTAPGPVPGSSSGRNRGGDRKLGDRAPLMPGLVPLSPLSRCDQPGCAPALPQTRGCRGCGSRGAPGLSLAPARGSGSPARGAPGPSFPPCSSATFAAPRAGAGHGGGRDCPCGSTRPSGREEGSGKNNPGPAPAHCGFLRFTALPGGKRQERPARGCL